VTYTVDTPAVQLAVVSAHDEGHQLNSFAQVAALAGAAAVSAPAPRATDRAAAAAALRKIDRFNAGTVPRTSCRWLADNLWLLNASDIHRLRRPQAMSITTRATLASMAPGLGGQESRQPVSPADPAQMFWAPPTPGAGSLGKIGMRPHADRVAAGYGCPMSEIEAPKRPRFLTIEQVPEELNVGLPTVRMLLKTRDLRGIQIGGKGLRLLPAAVRCAASSPGSWRRAMTRW